MAWIIPTRKYQDLRARYHTCTCPPDAEITYNWRDMRVVDADFEQPNSSSVDRYVWYTVGCYDCGQHVLDSIPFGVSLTGYALLMDARAETTEYIVDVNGGVLPENWDLHIRETVADAICSIWDRYHKAGGITGSCSHLLARDSELKVLYNSINLVKADYDKQRHGFTGPESVLRGTIVSAGHAMLGKQADDICTLIENSIPRQIYGKKYYYLPLPPHMVKPLSSCVSYAAGYPVQLATHLFATYGDTAAHSLSEAAYISSFVSSHKTNVRYFRLVITALAHYYHKIVE